MNKNKILERCIDTKGQKMVSIERLAKVLGIKPFTQWQINKLVESRKAAHLRGK